ncbi:MAG: AbrB/MazE/SpoVT family DNA-binding domain-containing protein [Rhizobiaceae bacterium]|nr:AbrB/MazE/SpoVT family DNA-binding domain-containing protein [Rhizobiaceae bacterium]
MGMPSKITSKGQITVPKAVRKRLNLKAGDSVEFVEVNGEFIFKPRNLRAGDLAGILGPPPSGETLTIDQMNEAIGQAASEDDRRITREWRKGRK